MLDTSAVPRFVACHPTTALALSSLGEPQPRKRAEITLAAGAASSSVARGWVAEQLRAWEVSDPECAVLVAAELVENALRHTRSECRLRVELHPAGLSVAVTDDDPRPPVLHSRDLAAKKGHFGLSLVEMMSRAWGHNPYWNGGKVVWAVLPMAGDSQDPADAWFWSRRVVPPRGDDRCHPASGHRCRPARTVARDRLRWRHE
jgi:hypothetical protein